MGLGYVPPLSRSLPLLVHSSRGERTGQEFLLSRLIDRELMLCFYLARSRHVVSSMIPALQRYLVNSKSGLAAAIRWPCMWCISLVCFIRAIQLSLAVFLWKIFSQKWHLSILGGATTLPFLTKWVVLCLIQGSSSSSLNSCWQPIIVLKGHSSS